MTGTALVLVALAPAGPAAAEILTWTLSPDPALPRTFGSRLEIVDSWTLGCGVVECPYDTTAVDMSLASVVQVALDTETFGFGITEVALDAPVLDYVIPDWQGSPLPLAADLVWMQRDTSAPIPSTVLGPGGTFVLDVPLDLFAWGDMGLGDWPLYMTGIYHLEGAVSVDPGDGVMRIDGSAAYLVVFGDGYFFLFRVLGTLDSHYVGPVDASPNVFADSFESGDFFTWSGASSLD